MSATALIVFREVLEAALIIGIVMAATQGIARRNLWVGIGVAAGLAGAVLVAVFAQVVAEAAAGMGQELLNASILFIAVAMLGWHNVWMSRHARAMSTELTAVGRAVRAAERPISVLAVVVGVAVLREGSEIVLFLYGIAAAPGAQASAMLTGGGIGLLLGGLVGLLIYFGLVQLAGRYLFAVTSGLILFLAAGLAAQGAGYLSQAGYLPPLGHALWDTSFLISDKGAVGSVLHILVGYTAQPEGIQVVFYGVTLLAIGGLMYLLRDQRRASVAIAAIAVGGALLALGINGIASADAAEAPPAFQRHV